MPGSGLHLECIHLKVKHTLSIQALCLATLVKSLQPDLIFSLFLIFSAPVLSSIFVLQQGCIYRLKQCRHGLKMTTRVKNLCTSTPKPKCRHASDNLLFYKNALNKLQTVSFKKYRKQSEGKTRKTLYLQRETASQISKN